MKESTVGEHNQGSDQVGDNQNERKPSPASQLTSSGIRRRVKRKVLKKKTFKDEEGYLGLRSDSHTRVYSTKSRLQLQKKNHHGSHSRKMSH